MQYFFFNHNIPLTTFVYFNSICPLNCVRTLLVEFESIDVVSIAGQTQMTNNITENLIISCITDRELQFVRLM